MSTQAPRVAARQAVAPPAADLAARLLHIAMHLPAVARRRWPDNSRIGTGGRKIALFKPFGARRMSLHATRLVPMRFSAHLAMSPDRK